MTIAYKVLNENILGFIDSREPDYLQILQASILLGALEVGRLQTSKPISPLNKIRDALRQDFEAFRVMPPLELFNIEELKEP